MKNPFANRSILYKKAIRIIFVLSFCNSCIHANALVDLSKDFLKQLRSRQDASDIVRQYAALQFQDLVNNLPDRPEKLAFWINTYNAFVIYLLREDPSRFDNRGQFFSGKQIDIAGILFSLDDIEHGIIRDARIKWSLGYLKKWFVPNHIRQLSIKVRESRVHFALNCGARSCPPVAIYDGATIFDQLDKGSRRYLRDVTKVVGNTVNTTPLLSWFRADFNGKKGIRKMLQEYNLVDSGKNYQLQFRRYDWSLMIGAFIDL